MSVAEVQMRIAAIEAGVNPATASAAASTDPALFQGVLGAAMDGSSGTSLLSNGWPSSSGSVGNDAVDMAARFQGVPYVWGGESPQGFDCSGLVQYVYGKLGVALPRVAADQARSGVPVTKDQLQPGDLVFFGTPVDHVGIYAGNGKMVVAPHRGDVVKVQDVNFDAVTAMRRVSAGSASGGQALFTTDGSSSSSLRLPPAGQQYGRAIQLAADKAGIDPKLLAAVAWTESNFRANAQSGAGAQGIMQLMPATAAGLGVDPSDPAQSLDGGARYLATQLRRFGRVDLALAAYNAGPTAVTKAGGIPPYPETQAYVQRVLGHMEEL